MNFKLILRDVAIIFGLTFVGGFVIGVLGAILSIPEQTAPLLIGLSNIVLGIIGFTIAGTSNPPQRWKHLLLVALCLWPLGLLNLLAGVTFVQWIFSIIVILFMMAVGGVISMAVSR